MTTGEPLAGRCLVVTRTSEQAGSLVGALTELGAGVVLLPMVAIVDPTDKGAALAAAVDNFGDYDRIVVTSPNGARRLLGALGGLTTVDWPPVAVIGPATAEPLRNAGVPIDLVPDRSVAESLLESLPLPPPDGGRLLLVRAESAREVLPVGLAQAGWTVDIAPAYRNVEPPIQSALLAKAQLAEAVVFMAASAVRRYCKLVGPSPLDALCIGPVSGQVAKDLGFRVTEAEPHSILGLVDAACRWAETLRDVRRLS